LSLPHLPRSAQVGGLIVVLFAAFCVHLLLDVGQLRRGLERRVFALIELQAMDRALDELGAPDADVSEQLAAIGASMADVATGLDALDDDALTARVQTLALAAGALAVSDGPSRASALSAVTKARAALVGELRSQNGQVSAALGERWNRLGAVVFASLALAVAMLAFMLIADRQRRRSEELRRELEQAYRDVRFARDEAESADRAKSRLLANVSHELRTPMNGVIGMADLLRGTALDSEQRDFLDVISGSGILLMTLVEQLLDFSILEGGDLELKRAEFDLLLATEEALVLVAPRASAGHVELSLHWAPEVPRGVIGDGARLRQIILNLLSNAVKFTPAGRIEVRVASARSDFGVSVVRFEVQDTGIGLPAGEFEDMFEPFVQGDSSRTSEGAGLGLAIVKRLVAAMEGQVGVDSDPGVGSTFWFSVPLRLGSDPMRRGQRLKRLSGKRMAVLDPDPVNRAVWEEEITRHGGGVRCTSELDELKGVIDAKTWLVSIALKRGETGRQAVAAVREVWPDVPIIFTAPMGWHEAPVGDGEEVLGMIHRPLRPSSLASRVLRLVLGPQLAAPGDDESSLVGLELGPMPGPGAKRVLVVDDHEINRRTVASILRRAGYDVRLATNGFEAVEQALAEDFDAVLMDLRMPDMDGIEATTCIREVEGEERHTPIVAMTGDAVPGDEARFREAGMDDLMLKPATPEALRAMTRKWAGENELS